MSSKYSKFLTGLFCLFIGGMLLVSTILPDREMSETENRYLQQAPTLIVRHGEQVEKLVNASTIKKFATSQSV